MFNSVRPGRYKANFAVFWSIPNLGYPFQPVLRAACYDHHDEEIPDGKPAVQGRSNFTTVVLNTAGRSIQKIIGLLTGQLVQTPSVGGV